MTENEDSLDRVVKIVFWLFVVGLVVLGCWGSLKMLEACQQDLGLSQWTCLALISK